MQALRQPEIYLKRMLTHTFLVGLATFIINWIYINTSMHSIKIPTGIHAMLGFVIAMLLVFRTNTAYERWWEGRKKIQDLKIAYTNILAIIGYEQNLSSSQKQMFFDHLSEQLDYVRNFLNSDEMMLEYVQIRNTSIMFNMIGSKTTGSGMTQENISDLRTCTQEINSIIISCERIKHPPIPFAYAIHVKLCIFIYVATLPFSLFHDLNLWSTPIVMALYFIISGTEIISNEIENPFQGEANDLPVDALIDEIKYLIPGELRKKTKLSTIAEKQINENK